MSQTPREVFAALLLDVWPAAEGSPPTQEECDRYDKRAEWLAVFDAAVNGERLLGFPVVVTSAVDSLEGPPVLGRLGDKAAALPAEAELLADLVTAAAGVIEKGSEFEGLCCGCGYTADRPYTDPYLADAVVTPGEHHAPDCIVRKLRAAKGEGWIPVDDDERLPAVDKNVLLWCDGLQPWGRITVGYRDHDEDDGPFWIVPDGTLRGHEVTHWRPLPEPPKT